MTTCKLINNAPTKRISQPETKENAYDLLSMINVRGKNGGFYRQHMKGFMDNLANIVYLVEKSSKLPYRYFFTDKGV